VNPGGLFCFLNVNGPRPNIYGKYLTDLFAPVTNLVLSAKVCLLVGVWGATEQKTGLRNDRYSSSGASGLRRGRN
jgi:hypothetical protein